MGDDEKVPAKGTPAATDEQELRVITMETLVVCKHSAGFWATHLGPYAQDMRKKSDWYKIAAGVFSTVTTLAVWTTLVDSVQLGAVIAVSVVGVITGFVAIMPQVKGYGPCAESAAMLADSYGQAQGELDSALEMMEKGDSRAQDYAETALAHFTAIRSQKQKLWPQPAALQKEVEADRKALGLDEKSLAKRELAVWRTRIK
jgi:hypothetical protein